METPQGRLLVRFQSSAKMGGASELGFEGARCANLEGVIGTLTPGNGPDRNNADHDLALG
jgi:hypothetical protein